jgi:MoaA/NifB/PqqE/SkfB family radical SAM enzyme
MNQTLLHFLERSNPHVNFSRTINMDISNKCTLECPCCRRLQHMKKYGKVLGETLSIKDFEKYLKYFDHFDFSGQVSDPSMHPDFKGILHKVIEYGKSASVHTAASHKPVKWYKEIYEECTNENISWFFGIDGLPEDSHKYRVRQDGKKLFDMMKMSTEYMDPNNIIWKYIVFKYNQHDIETCKKMARDIGVIFNVVYSNRFPSEEFRPDTEFQSTIPMLNKVYYPDGSEEIW